jgi:Cu(I)/Ag(I) efflux system protein CusF
MKQPFLKITAAVAAAVIAISAHAQQGAGTTGMGNMKTDCPGNRGTMSGMKGMDCMAKDKAVAIALTDGEVKNVDAAAGHVTLKHGAIENMQMPPMVMAFPVRDRSVLPGLKVGNKVKFTVENVDGVPTITSLVPEK